MKIIISKPSILQKILIILIFNFLIFSRQKIKTSVFIVMGFFVGEVMQKKAPVILKI